MNLKGNQHTVHRECSFVVIYGLSCVRFPITKSFKYELANGTIRQDESLHLVFGKVINKLIVTHPSMRMSNRVRKKPDHYSPTKKPSVKKRKGTKQAKPALEDSKSPPPSVDNSSNLELGKVLSALPNTLASSIGAAIHREFDLQNARSGGQQQHPAAAMDMRDHATPSYTPPPPAPSVQTPPFPTYPNLPQMAWNYPQPGYARPFSPYGYPPAQALYGQQFAPPPSPVDQQLALLTQSLLEEHFRNRASARNAYL